MEPLVGPEAVPLAAPQVPAPREVGRRREGEPVAAGARDGRVGLDRAARPLALARRVVEVAEELRGDDEGDDDDAVAQSVAALGRHGAVRRLVVDLDAVAGAPHEPRAPRQPGDGREGPRPGGVGAVLVAQRVGLAVEVLDDAAAPRAGHEAREVAREVLVRAGGRVAAARVPELDDEALPEGVGRRGDGGHGRAARAAGRGRRRARALRLGVGDQRVRAVGRLAQLRAVGIDEFRTTREFGAFVSIL